MIQEEINKRLEQASKHYNDGEYADAIALWNAVLAVEPENARAREGVQMAELLSKDWSEPEAAGPDEPATADGASQIQDALTRVHELLESGDVEAAREGVDVLMQIAPDDAAVRACAARVEAHADPESYVTEQLSLARHYVMMDEHEVGLEACRRVLAVQPENDEAKELLAKARGDQAMPGAAESPAPAGAPSAVPPPAPPPDDDFLDFDLDELADGEQPGPAAAEAGSTMDAGTPEERIQALLAEGDRLQAAGKLQDAVQVWSRVFILEDVHAEAEARIDNARRLIDDQAAQMDDLRYRGEDLLKAGKLQEARTAFEQILGILPNHQEAKELLQEVQRRMDAPTDPGAGDDEEIVAVPLAPTEEAPPPEPPKLDETQPTVPVPLTPLSRQRVPPPPPPAVPRRGVGKLGLVAVAIVGLIGLSFGGYLGWQALFPSVDLSPIELAGPTTASRVPEAAPTEAATSDAVPDAATADPVEPQPPAEDVRNPEAARKLVQEGSRLFEAGQYEKALAKFREALQLNPVNIAAKDWEIRAAEEVETRNEFQREIDSVRSAVADYDYESALKKLYRLESPTEAGRARVKQWIAVCWFNWGVLRMQSERLPEAKEKFVEASQLLPGDTEIRSHLDFLERYQSRQVDETFRAYAEDAALRALE